MLRHARHIHYPKTTISIKFIKIEILDPFAKLADPTPSIDCIFLSFRFETNPIPPSEESNPSNNQSKSASFILCDPGTTLYLYDRASLPK
ncbi:hypothetical protein A9Q99_27500 [Gammaproteobacteria bacterium 45_16_T64]|nr:hypothetical protein A9Q99_27500 [Gammaproteobacteria bacterium 45_16_T64]